MKVTNVYNGKVELKRKKINYWKSYKENFNILILFKKFYSVLREILAGDVDIGSIKYRKMLEV